MTGRIERVAAMSDDERRAEGWVSNKKPITVPKDGTTVTWLEAGDYYKIIPQTWCPFCCNDPAECNCPDGKKEIRLIDQPDARKASL
jgi:hypothetical protein